MEYLPTLTKRVKWKKETRSFKEGELVLLHDDDHTKRGKWPLARITKVNPGSDGVVRTVEVRSKDGNYRRPVSKLYKLEDNCMDHSESGHPNARGAASGDNENIFNDDGKDVVSKNVAGVNSPYIPTTPINLDQPNLPSPKLSQLPYQPMEKMAVLEKQLVPGYVNGLADVVADQEISGDTEGSAGEGSREAVQHTEDEVSSHNAEGIVEAEVSLDGVQGTNTTLQRLGTSNTPLKKRRFRSDAAVRGRRRNGTRILTSRTHKMTLRRNNKDSAL